VLDEFPDGWYVPLQRSLTKPDYFAYVPFGMAVLVWTFTLAMTLGAGKLWVLPIGMTMHAIAAAATKMDPHFFDVLDEHLRTKSYYGVNG
jgi:type IV secretory pathway TrbD component